MIKTIEEALPVTWCEHFCFKRNNLYDLFKNKTVIDVGCGTGFFAHEIKKKAKNVVGLDICKSNIDYANLMNKNKNILFITKDIHKFHTNKSFDVIFCSEAIEHFKDKQKVLNLFNKLIKLDGILFLVVAARPKHSMILLDVYKNFNKAYKNGAPEVHKGGLFISKNKLDALVGKNGFIKIFSKRFRSPLVVIIDLILLWFERKKRGDKYLESFGDHTDWFKSPLIKFYIIFLLPFVKFLAWIDRYFEFIDNSAEIILYKKVKI